MKQFFYKDSDGNIHAIPIAVVDTEKVDSLAQEVGSLDDLETTAKDDLVSAINELAESGGGSSEWELIYETTATEEITRITQSYDKSWKKIIILCNGLSCSTAPSGSIYFGNYSGGRGYLNNGYYSMQKVIFCEQELNGCGVEISKTSGNSAVTYTNLQIRYNSNQTDYSSYDGIYIYCTANIPIGFNIKVYGVK